MSFSLKKFKKAHLKWLEHFILANMITQAFEVRVYGVDTGTGHIAGRSIFDANDCVEYAEGGKGWTGTSAGDGDDGEHHVKGMNGTEVSIIPFSISYSWYMSAAF